MKGVDYDIGNDVEGESESKGFRMFSVSIASESPQSTAQTTNEYNWNIYRGDWAYSFHTARLAKAIEGVRFFPINSGLVYAQNDMRTQRIGDILQIAWKLTVQTRR